MPVVAHNEALAKQNQLGREILILDLSPISNAAISRDL
jgi:hypothetical protein